MTIEKDYIQYTQYKRVIDHLEVRVLDVNSEFLGVPTEMLMENAGQAVAEAVRDLMGEGLRIAIACGTGNNGGDGFVAARYLRERNEVKVVLVRPPENIKTELARRNFEKIRDLAMMEDAVELADFDVIIDGIFGTGIRGRIEQPWRSVIERINSSERRIVSIDIPSGLGADLQVKPELTVTLHDLKTGMNERNSGKIIVKGIGIPEDAERYVGPGEFAYYPIPRKESHKGENGRLLIVGGGPYAGAPALAGLAAYRIGVDLVHIATSRLSYCATASFSPNLIVHRLSDEVLVEGDFDTLRDLTNRVDAVLIGPGLGSDPSTTRAIRSYISDCRKPIVIDADAIGAISADLSVLENKRGVITPHVAELKELTGVAVPADLESRREIVRDLAARTGMTILLKGRIDVISDGTRVKMNRTGNEGMSVGGTGDVLAGSAAGLLSKGVTPFDAARIAAFATGYAGDLAFAERSFGLLATDVIEKIPAVLKEFLDKFI